MAHSGSDHGLVATAVRKARRGKAILLRLYQSRVPAGFPSPADDQVETALDLSAELIEKEESTFFVRVAGDSMTEAGIHEGDILVVDRSVETEDGSVVVAALDGELTVKWYEVHSGHPYLNAGIGRLRFHTDSGRPGAGRVGRGAARGA